MLCTYGSTVIMLCETLNNKSPVNANLKCILLMFPQTVRASCKLAAGKLEYWHHVGNKACQGSNTNITFRISFHSSGLEVVETQ